MLIRQAELCRQLVTDAAEHWGRLQDLGEGAKALFHFDPRTVDRDDLAWSLIAFAELRAPAWENAYGERSELQAGVRFGLQALQAATQGLKPYAVAGLPLPKKLPIHSFTRYRGRATRVWPRRARSCRQVQAPRLLGWLHHPSASAACEGPAALKACGPPIQGWACRANGRVPRRALGARAGRDPDGCIASTVRDLCTERRVGAWALAAPGRGP
jgi:hypothetical protein